MRRAIVIVVGGVFWGVDALAGIYPSWSPYSYVMGNPLRVIDVNGERTYFVDEDGNYLFTSDDTEEDAINIVPNSQVFLFKDMVNNLVNPHDGSLRAFGINYIISEIKKFVTIKNPIAKPEKGMVINRYQLNAEYSRKSLIGRALSEVGANLYMFPNSNTVHISEAYSDGDYESVWYQKKSLPLGAFEVGKIHDHPNSGTKLAIPVGFSFIGQDNYDDIGPSSGNNGSYGDRGHDSHDPVYNMLIERGQIFFYDKNRKDISVPINPFDQ